MGASLKSLPQASIKDATIIRGVTSDHGAYGSGYSAWRLYC